MKIYSNILMKGIGWGISIIFLYLTFRGTDVTNFPDYFEGLDILYLIYALIANGIFIVIRGLYQINNLCHINSEIHLSVSCFSVAKGLLFNVLYPARYGDFSKMLFLSRKINVNKSIVFSYLLIERLLDIIVILSLSIIVLYLNSGLYDMVVMLRYTVLLIMMILLFLFIYVKYNSLIVRIISAIIPHNVFVYLIKINADILKGFSVYKTKTQFLNSLLLLLLSWIVMLGVFWFISYPFVNHFHLPLYSCLVFMVFTALSLSVPSAPAGIGVMDYSLLLAVKTIGGDFAYTHIVEAAAFVISMHLFLLLCDLIVAGGFVLYGKLIKQYDL